MDGSTFLEFQKSGHADPSVRDRRFSLSSVRVGQSAACRERAQKPLILIMGAGAVSTRNVTTHESRRPQRSQTGLRHPQTVSVLISASVPAAGRHRVRHARSPNEWRDRHRATCLFPRILHSLLSIQTSERCGRRPYASPRPRAVSGQDKTR